MDNNSKSRCFYGKSGEDKHTKKDDIQSLLKLKSFMLKLPLALSKKNMSIMILYVCFWPRTDVEG